jgi:GxxExxY protein
MELLYKDEAYVIVGAAMEVHKELGHGFLEAVYQEALEKEFNIQNIPYKREFPISIYYKGKPLSKYYVADFICYDKIIVELKALSALNQEHHAQVLNYLKATGIELGILINFGTSKLEYKRIIREHSHNSRTNGGAE